MTVKGPEPSLSEVLAYGGCPRCKGRDVARPGVTWWGARFGPSLLNHAECRACGFWFNWKSGEPNAVPIVLFLVIAATLGLGFLFFVFGRHHR